MTSLCLFGSIPSIVIIHLQKNFQFMRSNFSSMKKKKKKTKIVWELCLVFFIKLKTGPFIHSIHLFLFFIFNWCPEKRKRKERLTAKRILFIITHTEANLFQFSNIWTKLGLILTTYSQLSTVWAYAYHIQCTIYFIRFTIVCMCACIGLDGHMCKCSIDWHE